MTAAPAPAAAANLAIHSHALCLVPLFSASLQGYDSARQQTLSRLILESRRQGDGVTVSNRYGWHSDTDLHLRQDDDIAWLMQQIGSFARRCLDSVNPDIRKARAMMTACWANVNERHAYNEPHSHLPSHWSGIFYVSAEDCLNPKDATDKAGCVEFINPVPLGKAYGSSFSYCVRPTDGMVLLFPAHVMHFVHPNLSDAARISISFNIDIEFPLPGSGE